MAFLIPEIWIIGSSIITHVEEVAYAKNQGDLPLEGRQFLWFGSRGTHWNELRPKVQREMLNRPPPVMLVTHVWGNDLVNIRQAKMMKRITKDIKYIHLVFPSSYLVCSDILPHSKWLGFSVFFLLFGGRNSAPFPLPKSMFFSPILKENSPQNEVFKKKKNRQNETTACRKCV